MTIKQKMKHGEINMAATLFLFLFFQKSNHFFRSHHHKVLISMLESVVTHYSNQIGEFKELSLLSGGQGANENFKLITSKAEYLFKICDEKSQKGLDLWVLILLILILILISLI